jgi:hypothetical protein
MPYDLDIGTIGEGRGDIVPEQIENPLSSSTSALSP